MKFHKARYYYVIFLETSEMQGNTKLLRHVTTNEER